MPGGIPEIPWDLAQAMPSITGPRSLLKYTAAQYFPKLGPDPADLFIRAHTLRPNIEDIRKVRLRYDQLQVFEKVYLKNDLTLQESMSLRDFRQVPNTEGYSQPVTTVSLAPDKAVDALKDIENQIIKEGKAEKSVAEKAQAIVGVLKKPVDPTLDRELVDNTVLKRKLAELGEDDLVNFEAEMNRVPDGDRAKMRTPIYGKANFGKASMLDGAIFDWNTYFPKGQARLASATSLSYQENYPYKKKLYFDSILNEAIRSGKGGPELQEHVEKSIQKNGDASNSANGDDNGSDGTVTSDSDLGQEIEMRPFADVVRQLQKEIRDYMTKKIIDSGMNNAGNMLILEEDEALQFGQTQEEQLAHLRQECVKSNLTDSTRGYLKQEQNRQRETGEITGSILEGADVSKWDEKRIIRGISVRNTMDGFEGIVVGVSPSGVVRVLTNAISRTDSLPNERGFNLAKRIPEVRDSVVDAAKTGKNLLVDPKVSEIISGEKLDDPSTWKSGFQQTTSQSLGAESVALRQGKLRAVTGSDAGLDKEAQQAMAELFNGLSKVLNISENTVSDDMIEKDSPVYRIVEVRNPCMLQPIHSRNFTKLKVQDPLGPDEVELEFKVPLQHRIIFKPNFNSELANDYINQTSAMQRTHGNSVIVDLERQLAKQTGSQGGNSFKKQQASAEDPESELTAADKLTVPAPPVHLVQDAKLVKKMRESEEARQHEADAKARVANMGGSDTGPDSQATDSGGSSSLIREAKEKAFEHKLKGLVERSSPADDKWSAPVGPVKRLESLFIPEFDQSFQKMSDEFKKTGHNVEKYFF